MDDVEQKKKKNKRAKRPLNNNQTPALANETEKIYHRFYTGVDPHFEQHYC